MGVSGAWLIQKEQETCCTLAAEAGVGVAIQCHLGGHQEGQQAATGRVPGAMSQRLERGAEKRGKELGFHNQAFSVL